jgi:hypothetical protein
VNRQVSDVACCNVVRTLNGGAVVKQFLISGVCFAILNCPGGLCRFVVRVLNYSN